MSVIVRTIPAPIVTLNGQLAPNVLAAWAEFSYINPVAQARILYAVEPTSAVRLADVGLDMGATVSGMHRRFTGKMYDVDYRLWPRAVELVCYGSLKVVEIGEASTDDGDGIDLSNGGLGMIDEEQVEFILDFFAIASHDIHGTGYLLGTYADESFLWAEGESGLSFIQRKDEIGLGYRTFDSPGGTVLRRLITASPAGGAALSFAEHIDIEEGSASFEIINVKNRVKVTGFDGIEVIRQQSAQGNLPFNVQYATLPISNAMVEKEFASDPGDGIAADEVAAWQLGEHNRRLKRVTFTTPRDDLIVPGMTVFVHAPSRLNISANMWVQSVRPELSEAGTFSQTLVCIAGDQSTAPIVTPPYVDFTMQVEIERVVISDAPVTLYVVYAKDVSVSQVGIITTRDWSSGGTPATGSGATYIAAYTDLTGESITLTVTDDQGNTGTRIKSILANVPATQHLVRKMTLVNTEEMERYTGVVYNVDPEDSGQDVLVAANGPLAGAGTDVMVTADDLATSASEYKPFPGVETVTALWLETDANASLMGAGSSAGKIALSTDTGVTWTVKAGPLTTPVLRIVINRYNTAQISLLYATGLYRSDNSGTTWILEQAAASGETFRDVSFSHTRSMIVMDGGRLAIDRTGVVQTFPALSPAVADVVAVTADILEDRFYVYDAEGRTFYTDDPAVDNTLFVQGADLPDTAQPMPRGMWRDGAFRRLIYFANGTNGAWKTLDGFETTGGMWQLRKPGIDGSHASADYVQVGLDGLLVKPTVATGTGKIYVATNSGIWVRTAATRWRRLGIAEGITSATYIGGPFGFPDTIYAATNIGFVRSDDAGETWTSIHANITGVGLTSGQFRGFMWKEGDEDRIWLYWDYSPTGSACYMSTNRGVSWAAYGGMGGGGGRGVAAHSGTGNRMFFPGYNGGGFNNIRYFDDFAGPLTVVGSMPGHPNFPSLAAIRGDASIVWVIKFGSGSNVRLFTVGGGNVIQTVGGANLGNLPWSKSGGVGLAGHGGNLYRTTDHGGALGTNWTLVKSGVSSPRFDPASATDWYALNGLSLYASTDDGATFGAAEVSIDDYGTVNHWTVRG